MRSLTLWGEEGISPWWVALGGLVVTVVPVITTAMIMLLKGWSAERRKKRADAINEWRDLVVRLEAQIERQGAVLDQQNEALTVVRQELANCRADHADRVGDVKFLYARLCSMHRTMHEAGLKPEPLPDMTLGEIRSGTASGDPDFLAKQSQQAARLVREAQKAIDRTRPPDLEE